jgi:hypothetical protein
LDLENFTGSENSTKVENYKRTAAEQYLAEMIAVTLSGTEEILCYGI